MRRQIVAPNGTKYKFDNKSVSVITNEEEDVVLIQFAIADGDKTPRSIHFHRLGVTFTTIKLSKESAACIIDGLMYLFQTKFNQPPLP